MPAAVGALVCPLVVPVPSPHSSLRIQADLGDVKNSAVLVMMIRVGFVAVIMFSLSPARASEQLDACMDKANTQHAMHVCASEEAGRRERERQSLLQRVLNAVDGDALAIRQVNASEKAWLAYRASFIEAMYPATDKQAEYGSRHPMDVNLLHANLTISHLADLEALLEQTAGDAK